MTAFNPREKQKEVLELCKTHKRYGVFMDMGTGKTATMLSLIDYLSFETLDVSNVLIIAPATIITKAKVWQKEIKKWNNFEFFDYVEVSGTAEKRKEILKNNKNNTITLMSVSLLEWWKKTYKDLSMFDMIIIDESSKFKSVKSSTFKHFVSMINKNQRLYLLSGTPMPKDYSDLWTQMFLIDNGERLGTNFYKFQNKYALKYGFKIVYPITSQNAIKTLINDICTFVDSSEVELPDKKEHIVTLKWSEEHHKKYKYFLKENILAFEEGEVTASQITTVISKALQLANGCVYIDKEQNYKEFDRSKLEWVKNFAKTSKSNMLVFYNFKFDKERLMQLEGAREIMTTQDVDDWNAGKIKIGVISPYSFQYGANLQEGGSTIIWFGLQWGLENYLQSNKRLWRSGQKEEVNIYYLLMENTYDKDVYDRLISKEKSEEDFLESINLKRKRDR